MRDAVQRDPAVDGVERHGEVRHAVILVKQRRVRRRERPIDGERLRLREFSDGLEVQAERAHTPVELRVLLVFPQVGLPAVREDLARALEVAV